MSQSRVQRVHKLLSAMTPYRFTDRQIRVVLAVLPQPRQRYRACLERAVAAIVALPYRITGVNGGGV